MKLEDVLSTYYEASNKLSEVTRQLNFAGIAVIWIFKVGKEGGGIQFTAVMEWSLGCFVVSLALDFLQYFWKSIIWSAFHRCKEYYGVKKNDEFLAPPWFNYPTLFFFYTKAILTAIGFGLLIAQIASALFN